jgi:hypothetical protein
MEEAENELRDVPPRIARERVPTIAVEEICTSSLMLTRTGAAGLNARFETSVRA